jgi:hypothetical protein
MPAILELPTQRAPCHSRSAVIRPLESCVYRLSSEHGGLKVAAAVQAHGSHHETAPRVTLRKCPLCR